MAQLPPLFPPHLHHLRGRGRGANYGRCNVFIVNFEYISQLWLVFLWLTLKSPGGILKGKCFEKFRTMHKETAAMASILYAAI